MRVAVIEVILIFNPYFCHIAQFSCPNSNEFDSKSYYLKDEVKIKKKCIEIRESLWREELNKNTVEFFSNRC